MTRSQRLLALLQQLRSHRYPVSGQHLAEKLGISLRTLYRDIATLQEQGAEIQGEAGLGYVLKPGFMLPPLMFSEEELEALVLGSRWVAARADTQLSLAAKAALHKIAAVLPAMLKQALDANALLIGPPANEIETPIDPSQLREAIRRTCKVRLQYFDLKAQHSERIIWPFALGYFDHARVLLAWCESRQDFRHFRTDRITEWKMLDEHYPTHRLALLKKWRITQGIDTPDW